MRGGRGGLARARESYILFGAEAEFWSRARGEILCVHPGERPGVDALTCAKLAQPPEARRS